MRGHRSTGSVSRGSFQPELRLDEGNQGLRPEHLQGALQVVGQTCKLISVRTRGRVLVRKCVDLIHAFSVPKGCSAVCRRSLDACGVRSRRRLHIIEHLFVFPAGDAAVIAGCTSRFDAD